MIPVAANGFPQTLQNTLSHPTMPWVVSDRLQARTNNIHGIPDNEISDNRVTSSRKICPVLTSDPDYRFISIFFSHQAPHRKQIQAIYYLENVATKKLFEGGVEIINNEGENPYFKPRGKEEEPRLLRQTTMQKWDELRQQFSQVEIPHSAQRKKLPHTTVFPLWHGTNSDKSDSILHSGFTSFGKHNYFSGGAAQGVNNSTDVGYFGSGIYFTNSARYATMYAQDRLILSWVAMREPYPVVNDGQGPHGSDMRKLTGKEHYQNYNAHFIPVVADPRNPLGMDYYPCAAGQNPVWYEFVVFQTSQVLPQFMIVLSDITIPAVPPSSREEKYLRACQLQKADPSSRDALRLIQEAAQAGYARALNHLGYFHSHGNLLPRNPQEAFRCYSNAARQGYVIAMHNLALCYMIGFGIAGSHPEAAKWFQRAINFGSPYDWQNLQLCSRLSIIYSKSEPGIKQKYEKALETAFRLESSIASEYDIYFLFNVIGHLNENDLEKALNCFSDVCSTTQKDIYGHMYKYLKLNPEHLADAAENFLKNSDSPEDNRRKAGAIGNYLG